ncbi:MAG: hypothetical protein P4L87_10980, partial [Formivibrio sp.]|nr:hypothetical protein [Formivibrio sp.]
HTLLKLVWITTLQITPTSNKSGSDTAMTVADQNTTTVYRLTRAVTAGGSTASSTTLQMNTATALRLSTWEKVGLDTDTDAITHPQRSHARQRLPMRVVHE